MRKSHAGAYANREITLMYWEIGHYINSLVLNGNRAVYGKRIVTTLSSQLEVKYGKTFDLHNLRRMLRFAERFPDFEIVTTLSSQLTWSHFVDILPLKTDEARLKIGKFKPAYKGQMELYLKWLDRYERRHDENPPIGIILCTTASREQIELLELSKSGIAVAEYWTAIPPKAEFERKIRQILAQAKERLARRRLLPRESAQREIEYFYELDDDEE